MQHKLLNTKSKQFLTQTSRIKTAKVPEIVASAAPCKSMLTLEQYLTGCTQTAARSPLKLRGCNGRPVPRKRSYSARACFGHAAIERESQHACFPGACRCMLPWRRRIAGKSIKSEAKFCFRAPHQIQYCTMSAARARCMTWTKDGSLRIWKVKPNRQQTTEGAHHCALQPSSLRHG